jgi:uncharacterized membrane protein YebE (DUF533 family)
MSGSKRDVLKAVLALAHADGTLDENEQRLVDFLIDSWGLSPEEEAAVRAQSDAKVDLDQLAREVTDPKERAQAYEAACLVTQMDGQAQAAESWLLGDLRKALAIDDAAAHAIEEKAAAIYARFKERQA